MTTQSEAQSQAAQDARLVQDKPFAAGLTAKYEEFNHITSFLESPEPGAKITKYGDRFYFQAPSLTQGLYRWAVGESRDTTKEYLVELADKLIVLLFETKETINTLTDMWKKKNKKKFGRLHLVSGDEPIVQYDNPVEEQNSSLGLRYLIDVKPTPARIQEIAGLLKQSDTLKTRMVTAIKHAKSLYGDIVRPKEESGDADANDANDIDNTNVQRSNEAVKPAVSANPALSSYDELISRVSGAHSSLCDACLHLQN